MTEIRYNNRIKLKVNDEHLCGIGLVALSWSTLEEAVERIVWRLAGIDDDRIGISITTHTNIQTRLDAARTLMNLRFPDSDPANRLKKLNRYTRNHLMPDRNEIVHSRIKGDIFTDPQIVARIVARARGKLKHGYVDVLPSDYEETALAILGAATEARDILSITLEMIEAQSGAPNP